MTTTIKLTLHDMEGRLIVVIPQNISSFHSSVKGNYQTDPHTVLFMLEGPNHIIKVEEDIDKIISLIHIARGQGRA